MDGLYFHMDNKLDNLFPPLKRTVHLLTSLKTNLQESHIQYMERVKTAMLTGGVGCRASFYLSWDKLIIILTIKGLSNANQCEILCCFDTFHISMDNLIKFLLTLAPQESLSLKRTMLIIVII